MVPSPAACVLRPKRPCANSVVPGPFASTPTTSLWRLWTVSLIPATITRLTSLRRSANRCRLRRLMHSSPAILSSRGKANFITEVSRDETDAPQNPAEVLVILAALADHGVPVRAVASKFTGRFNKGVDYVGDLAKFESEFRSDVAVLAHGVRTYHLPAELKLSVHSGSDEFSIYPAIRRVRREFDSSVHVKTAGNTWLEQVLVWPRPAATVWRLQKKFTLRRFPVANGSALRTRVS